MTVGTLRTILSCYDDKQKIVIGQRQNYGSDFVYNICEDIEEHGVNKFYGKDIPNAVMLLMGSQIGTIKDTEGEDDE
jgi:hypothetical protein